MRAWLITLAITSAAFAATTVYLARELSLERARQAEAAPPVVLAPARTVAPPEAASSRSVAPAVDAISPSSGSVETTVRRGPDTSLPMSEEDMRKAQMEFSRRFLARLADPQQREELLVERKIGLRHTFPRVDQVLGLTAEEYARFIELQALQQLDMQEASSRCSLDPHCQARDVFQQAHDQHARDIANLLGPERTQKFETYRNSLSEREAVSQLRTRLSDRQRLGDDQAEQLITALAQEREAIHREAVTSGTGMQGFGVGAGMVFSPDDGRSLEERMEAARQNSRRMRDRAAVYLNPEQLRLFEEMQDETLLSLRSMLRSKGDQSFSAVAITRQ
jgi:hypothetical protein